jgi:hypothetical protein
VNRDPCVPVDAVTQLFGRSQYEGFVCHSLREEGSVLSNNADVR